LKNAISCDPVEEVFVVIKVKDMKVWTQVKLSIFVVLLPCELESDEVKGVDCKRISSLRLFLFVNKYLPQLIHKFPLMIKKGSIMAMI